MTSVPELPQAFRVAQVVGITGSLWLSGSICGLSSIAIPPLLRSTQIKNDKIGDPGQEQQDEDKGVEDQSDLQSEGYAESFSSSQSKSKSRSSRSGKSRSKHKSRSEHAPIPTAAAAAPVPVATAVGDSGSRFTTTSTSSIINLARQWKSMYSHGSVQNPPIAAFVAGTFYYVTWQIRSKPAVYERLVGSNDQLLYCGAAFLTLGIVPWTLIAMMKTNFALEAIAAGDTTITTKDERGDEDVHTVSDDEFDGLIRRWQLLNGIRGVFPLVSGLLGLYAALS